MPWFKRGFSLFFALLCLLIAGWANTASAQSETYELGTVIRVLQEVRVPTDSGTELYWQELEVQLNSSKEVVPIQFGSEFQPLNPEQRLREGQNVVVTSSPGEDGDSIYNIQDPFRLGPLFFLFALFLIAVVLVARWQGASSIIGMALTLLSLQFFLLPAILDGFDPLAVTLLWAAGVALVTLYLSHGFTFHAHISLLSLIIVIVLVGLLSSAAVFSMHLTGLGSEEALFLRVGGENVQLQGLLLAGIMLGVLGVLDDICLSQVAVVEELFFAKPTIKFRELIQRSLRIGRTHVASLVNTLVLAYAGANLPLFLLFRMNPQPLWVTLNSEILMEEMVRTLAGSIGLVLAVPVCTFIAAAGLLFLPDILPFSPKPLPEKTHHHH